MIRTGIILEKSLNIDRQELDEMERKEKDFLISALRSYIRCLQLSDSLDTLLHRYPDSLPCDKLKWSFCVQHSVISLCIVFSYNDFDSKVISYFCLVAYLF